MFFTCTRTVIWITMAVCITGPLSAQKPLKVDFMKYYDQLLVPPSTSKEAHAKADCQGDGSQGCNADTLYASLKATFEEYLKDLTASSMSGGSDERANLIKQMQDPDFQKKMATMSQEEKMKMAMQISQGMQQPTATTAEPPQVITVMQDAGKINEEIGADAGHMNEHSQAEIAHRQKIDKEHAAVDAWQEAETKKLPVVHELTGDYPEPKALHALKLAAIDKHLAIVDRELQLSIVTWKKDIEREKVRYGKFSTDLAAIHYGDDATNDVTRNSIMNAQSRMVNSLQMLLGRSNVLWNDAATWYQKRVSLEAEKP